MSGEVYRYLDVPAGVHLALMRAESLGQYFQAHIRDQYEFERPD